MTRLFHQALADELLAGRHQPGDESLLLDLLLSQAARLGWDDDYARQHTAEHASAAGRLDEILIDTYCLLAADPSRILPQLDGARTPAARMTATVYRQCAHLFPTLSPAARASEFEIYARHLGHDGLADRVAGAVPGRPWRSPWSQGRLGMSHQTLTGHRGWVTALTTSELADGTPVVISGGEDGTIRIWRLADGTPHGRPFGGRSRISALAAGTIPDGTPVIVSADAFEGTVLIWRLADGSLLSEYPADWRRDVRALAAGVSRDGTPVFISAGGDGTPRVWEFANDDTSYEPLTGRDGPVNALATASLGNGRTVVIGGYEDGGISVWRLGSGMDGWPVTGDDPGVNALSSATLRDGTAVIISAHRDGIVRVWRLADCAPYGDPLTADALRGINGELLKVQALTLRAVAAGVLRDGTPVVITGGEAGTVRVQPIEDSNSESQLLTGHHGPVTRVTAAALPDGTPVVISGGQDGTVRVWRLADSGGANEPISSDSSIVNAVATATLTDGTPVAVSGGQDGTVRVWRLADGMQMGKPLTGHAGVVESVAAATLTDCTPVAVSGSQDGTVRVWRLADGMQMVNPLTGHASWVTTVAAGTLADGTPIIVSGGADGTVRVRRLADGTYIGQPITGQDWVDSVATTTMPDGTPVIISSGYRRTVIWRLPRDRMMTGRLARIAWEPYVIDQTCHALATGALPDGTPVIIGGCDAEIQIWRLADGTTVGQPLRGHFSFVIAVATWALPDGTPVIVSAGVDATVRVWRLADGSPMEPSLSLPTRIRGIATHGDHVITAGTSIAVHSPTALTVAVTARA